MEQQIHYIADGRLNFKTLDSRTLRASSYNQLADYNSQLLDLDRGQVVELRDFLNKVLDKMPGPDTIDT